MELVVRPIGFVRSPFVEKAQAPRQGVAGGAAGSIEILAEYEDALDDLEGFDRVWILFWFHEASSAPAPNRVLPPRSDVKRGVFATRSPHRPNPIGMTAARLDRVEGRVVHLRDLDVLDGTPVLDLKPYVPYADAFPDARAGWLDAPQDPRPTWEVRFEPLAETQLAWIEEHGGEAPRSRIAETLALGPQPHAYRRIKARPDGSYVLAVKEWRVSFAASEGVVRVLSIASGWRASELAAHPLHLAFVAAFGG